jgi:hypothetical protein
LKDDKEQSDMTKRNQFTMHECIPLYTSMCDLNNELASMFPAAVGVPARPKYSTALRTAIVREQLNVRKWVYGRKIAEGDLCSSMADGNETKIRHLTATLAAIMEDERRVPPKKRPPKIRADYIVGPNPTSFRKLLDAERNAATKALEAQFVREHPGSVFQGDDFPLFLMSLCMSSFIGLFRLYELSIYVCLLTSHNRNRSQMFIRLWQRMPRKSGGDLATESSKGFPGRDNLSWGNCSVQHPTQMVEGRVR